MELLTLTLNLFVAVLLGAIIGLERQWRQRSAGLRTNTLVSLGSAAYIMLSALLTQGEGDPSRVAAQIVTGIGFIGAGVIMKQGLSVQGLNTAATIWCSAAVGCLAGAGLHAAAAITATAVVATHLMLRPLAVRLGSIAFPRPESSIHLYRIHLRCLEHVEAPLRTLLLTGLQTNRHLRLRSLTSRENEQAGQAYVEANIRSTGRHDLEIESLVGKLLSEAGVQEVRWEVDQEMTES
jgi:putative Mg2+ transporter-C (MgtC) family protein